MGLYFVDGHNVATNICYVIMVPYGELYYLFGEKMAALGSQNGCCDVEE